MIVKAIILGIVQGLTEFLPISSSGHLALLERYFGISEPVVIATFLHFGTFLATVVFFFREIATIIRGSMQRKRENLLYVLYIVLGTIPIVVFALAFRDTIEQTFTQPIIIALLLGVTGVVLIMTSIVRQRNKPLTFFSAMIIGISQLLAVFPGISRSGITISAGLFSKVKPEEAFKFSFLLSLPAVFGANLLEAITISRFDHAPSIIIGMICSFCVGLVALKILKHIVHKYFHLFGIYCLVVSIILLIIQ